jgi:hypothetical protein
VRSTLNRDFFEIDVMYADASSRHRLKAEVNTNNEPVTSPPHGQKVAFDNEFDIWVMDANGGNPHALGVEAGQAPAWSPDGKRQELGRASTGRRGLPQATVSFLLSPCPSRRCARVGLSEVRGLRSRYCEFSSFLSPGPYRPPRLGLTPGTRGEPA